MITSNCAVVFVHGLFSSASAWRNFDDLIASDPALGGLAVLHFEYSSPKFRLSPLKCIPDYNVVADNLQTYLEIETAEYSNLILVSHSQGGLIIQRYLARTLSRSRAQDLKRIRRIIFLACPNSGSELFAIVRRGMWFWRHPQERELRPINEAVTEAQQIVLGRIVHATSVSPDQCPIPIVAYAGESDRVVTPASAKGVFANTGVIPGDHFTILRPTSPEHRAYTTLRANFLPVLKMSREKLNGEPDDAPGYVENQSWPPVSVAAENVRSATDQASADNNLTAGDYQLIAAELKDAQVVARWNPRLRTVDFILSPEVALSWIRELGGEGRSDE